MAENVGGNDVEANRPRLCLPTSLLNCSLCGLCWTIGGKKLTGELRIHPFLNEQFCQKCFSYVTPPALTDKEFTDQYFHSNWHGGHPPLQIDPYDLRNWRRVDLPSHLHYCCACVVSLSLNQNPSTLLETHVYAPYPVHRYCFQCFFNRIDVNEEGLSPFGCCKQWITTRAIIVAH